MGQLTNDRAAIWRNALADLHLPEAVFTAAVEALEKYRYDHDAIEYVLVGGPRDGKTIKLQMKRLGDVLIYPMPPKEMWAPDRRAIYMLIDSGKAELVFQREEVRDWH